MPPTRNAWRDAIRASALPPAQRAVAQALAAFWPTGTTLPVLWRTVPELAADTGYSERSITRALKGLQDTGWVVVVEKARQHRAPRYAPTVPDHATRQGGQDVTPDAVDNHAEPVGNTVDKRVQGGQDVTPAETPGVTSCPARGDTMSPDPKDPNKNTPPTPQDPTGDDTHDRTRRGGWPTHIHEANATRALAALAASGRLPLDAEELLDHAYRVGAGDPWAGYLTIKPHLERTLEGSRDARQVLLARLRNAS